MDANTKTKSNGGFPKRFIDRLGDLPRGNLATLRRDAGCTIAESRGGMDIFYRLYGNGDERVEEIYFLVATLFDLNRDRPVAGNFGATMRAARPPGSGDHPLDRRMSILLDSQFGLVDGYKPGGGELGFRLRQCVKLAASKRAGVNWPQLVEDLTWWSHPDKKPQKRWARAYYGQPCGEPDSTSMSQTSQPEASSC
jgi:CRISPR system Cascade subunit CasB